MSNVECEKINRYLQALDLPALEVLQISSKKKRNPAVILSTALGFMGFILVVVLAVLYATSTKSWPTTFEVRLWALATLFYHTAWWVGRRSHSYKL